jgi:GT2 family glycosyltransferase
MNASNPEISVVIANYNGSHALALTISSLLVQQGVNIREIMLIDNQSTDDSIDLVNRKFASVMIISTGSNNGPNPARNLGLHRATSELVLIMDNDLVLAPDYCSRLANLLESHPDAGAASGKIRYHKHPEVVQYNGIDIHYAGEIRLNDPAARGTRVFSCVSAGAMLVRKSAVERVGWFDEDYVFGWEDGDLAYRLSMSGHPCWVDSDANAFHQSMKRGLKWIRYQTRNRWWFLRKNYDRRTFYLSLPAVLLFQGMAGLFMIIKGQGKAFLCGTWDGWRNGQRLNEKYTATQSLRVVSDRDLLCGDKLSLPAGLNRTLAGKFIGALVCMIFRIYWNIIRTFIKR